MTTLAENFYPRYEDDAKNDVPVIAADIIYQGAAVGDNASGFARPLVAADPFLGFADDKADNSAGAAGDVAVRVKEEGFIIIDVVGVVDEDDKDEKVYASDDNTFTLTSTSNSLIGKVRRWISGTKCSVYFQAVGKNRT